MPSSEEVEHVSIYTPSGIALDLDSTSNNGIVDGLADLPPPTSSVPQSTHQDLIISGSTSNDEASQPADPALGCRPVLEDSKCNTKT